MRHAGRTANPVPVAVDLDVHQLQLDAGGLPLRREAVDAAQLPARGPRPRRADAAVARGAADRDGHHDGFRYRVDYTTVDATDYRVPTGGGSIEAKIVVLAAGAMGTPVILQRSAAGLGGVPDALGRNFSRTASGSNALMRRGRMRLGARAEPRRRRAATRPSRSARPIGR